MPTTYAGEYLPWYATGWDAAAEAWIREQVHAAGLRLTGPIEEVRRWCLACVLRAPTDAGAVFFKEAVRPPVFADEPRFTAALAELYPDFLPQVIAVDAPRSWLLTMDCGAGADQDNLDLLTRYAPLQRRAVDDVDTRPGGRLRHGGLDHGQQHQRNDAHRVRHGGREHGYRADQRP